MKKDFILLKKEFDKIKKMGLIKPMRKGTTGIGYTFETLLNKKEDQDCKPDFRGIEIKTKIGYSKSPITLFNCSPERNNNSAINYIFEKYSYPKYHTKNIFIFERLVFSKNSIIKYDYEFRLFVDYYGKQLIMQAFYKNKFLENVCYWNFKTLENKLKIKLNKLAIIYAYPYRRENTLFYRYLKINTYKLKEFLDFLRLIEEDKIHVQFYLKDIVNSGKNRIIENHGVSFRIENKYIKELFTKINL